MFLEALRNYYGVHDTQHTTEMSILEDVLPTYYADEAGHPAIQALSYGETPFAIGADLLDWVGLRPEEAFLDMGCGCGGMVLLAAHRCRHAAGVDLSPAAIEFARTAAEVLQVPNADFHQQDLLRTDPTPYQVVYCCATAVSQWLTGELTSLLQSCLPGTRILTVTYPLNGVQPCEQRSLKFSWCRDRYTRTWDFYLHRL